MRHPKSLQVLATRPVHFDLLSRSQSTKSDNYQVVLYFDVC